MKYFLFILIFIVSLHSEIIKAKYDVSYGLFGKVGKSEAILVKKENRYKIEISAKAEGLAKILSNNRKESYISEGIIENGRLVPLVYKKVRQSSKKKDIKIYKFDHKNRKIYVHVERYKNGKLDKRKDETLKYYAKDDLLSLYFNINKYIDFKKSGKKRYTFYAVGGNRKDGKIDIEIPSGHTLKELKELLNEDGKYLVVTIYQKIFASKEGKLYIVMNDNGFTKKAMLKDVILFGDIVGKLKRLEVRE
ncbi:DUF3108 domain-containing protein [Nitrosophilus kaiyonis]|uniref:DUF3108 domain-containing protein n=1 Tax=Nitrosophilus kaiyonis TaxID=2930200 RepID=UPI002491D048|nr:DUF3108 domain-containing protein [Nitrosophilus kaiyonis]